jgi:alkanesulfonate monooxygenase SsuD/methylene tetrahydromethanopterin reductase-like flavin-dependent oxidoreductase (luciferase family)
MNPGMLRAIGRVADGGLPFLFPPEHFSTASQHIAGLAEAGRNEDDVDVAACIWCSVSADGNSAEDVLREKIAYYGHALSPLILSVLGVDRDEFEPIQSAINTDRNPVRARTMVTPEHVEDRNTWHSERTDPTPGGAGRDGGTPPQLRTAARAGPHRGDPAARARSAALLQMRSHSV